jgi:hypothetical protein
MEKNINLAKILNGKPVNTKLWSPLFGDVYTSSICSEDTIIVVNHHAESSSFYNNGKYFNHAEAELLLFPSKEMRDWSKFAWKKGDVLVSNDGGTEVIFDKWYDDTYTNFYSKHYLNSEDENNIKYNEAFLCTTERYSLEDKDTAQTYINTIEKRLGGKLNLDTLEIEKTQPEFKDGDIVCISGMGYLTYGIVKSIDNSSKKLEYYVLNDMSTLNFEDWLSFEDKHIQPITETQQIILFDALEKEGKAWDAEKKQIVDIKKEHQFKPFEKVLVRDSIDDVWRASFFSHIKENDGRYVTTCVTWKFCIPYIGNESLLGTTKDVEG